MKECEICLIKRVSEDQLNIPSPCTEKPQCEVNGGFVSQEVGDDKLVWSNGEWELEYEHEKYGEWRFKPLVTKNQSPMNESLVLKKVFNK